MDSLPDPRHIRDVTFDLFLEAARSGALPIEELEKAAAEGNTVATRILVALELEEATR